MQSPPAHLFRDRPLSTAAVAMAALLLRWSPTCLAEESDPGKRWQLFTSGQYATYLENLDAEVGGKTPDWLQRNSPKITAVAISLYKTGQTQGALAEAVRQDLRPSPDATRYFEADLKLLGGDLTAVEKFFDGEPPSPDLWQVQTDLFRTSACPEAATAFGIVRLTSSGHIGFDMPSPPEGALRGLQALPPDKRNYLVDLLNTRLGKNWYRRVQLAQAASRLGLGKTEDEANAFVDVACRLDPSGEFASRSTASDYASAGPKTVAMRLLNLEYEKRPILPYWMSEVGQILRQAATPEQGSAFFEARLPGPGARHRRFRREYITWLLGPGRSASKAWIAHLGTLWVADQALSKGSRAAAAGLYTSIVDDTRNSAEMRLDALAGLAESEPTQAVPRALALLPAAEKDDEVDFVCAVAVMCWRAKSVLDTGQGEANRPWLEGLSGLISQVAQASPHEFLAGNSDEGRESNRLNAAIITAWAGHPDQADALLSQIVEYDIPAPPGGWRGPPGTGAPNDANQPRHFVSPEPNSLPSYRNQLAAALAKINPPRATGPNP